MNMQRRSILLAGLVAGAALGIGSTYVWFKRPGWLPYFGASVAQDRPANSEHDPADGALGPADGRQDAQEEGVVRLSSDAARKFGIEVAPAEGGELEQTLTLPGQIVLNADMVAHIVPRVAGFVRRVDKCLGDVVQAGEVMAVLQSRELAEAKAAYLAAKQRLSLADATLKSAEELHAKKIMPDLQFLAARRDQVDASIEVETADNKLHAIGVSEGQEPGTLPSDSASLAIYELRAPFAGIVVERHCSLGEVLNGETMAFKLADLSTVWVDVTVYMQHLPLVQVGQSVIVIAGRGAAESSAVIDYISPVVDEDTRTATARLTLPNPDGKWRPGLFVSARVRTGVIPAAVLVPKAAVQTIQGKPCVFVETGGLFKVRPVTVGRSDGSRMEVTAGLKPGERYVTANAFTLKSELGKGGFGK
ncbi:Cobalt-zinc-cadmium resistance protein CzcB [Phycisphaerae bacterium RAS1]|nr:Cobalt-zinc-cadmium resistance protein CzcB [Phycisphaerae bacterium RAS1]